MHGEQLAQELRLTEPMVLCSVVKWCWARLPGGVVGWEAYELFRVGEAGNMNIADLPNIAHDLQIQTWPETLLRPSFPSA